MASITIVLSLRMQPITLALLILITVLPLPVVQASTLPEASLHFEGPDHLNPLMTRLSGGARSSVRTALSLTGLAKVGAPIRIILAPDHSPLSRETPTWVSGYAIPQANVIILFPNRVVSYPYDSLDSVLAHELTHIFAARAARLHPLPRWFDEGLAMLAADRWDVEDRARLLMAILGGHEVSRQELEHMFRGDAASARQAYVLSAAFVRSMVSKWGHTFPGEVLALVGQGVPFPDAFARVTSVSLDAFEASFWSQQRWWNRWLPILTSSTVLWAGITLLTLYAFRRRRQQARAIQREWELEREDRNGDR